MARRKIRPIGILACIAVFLLFQLFRKGGSEVFTFDSLPPYTDDGRYVKKPPPPSVPWTQPPPPPPEWGQSRQSKGAAAKEQKPAAKIEDVPVVAKPKTPPKIDHVPDRPAKQKPETVEKPKLEERPTIPDTSPKKHEPVIEKEEKEHPFAEPPVTDWNNPNFRLPSQPPSTGDFFSDHPGPEFLYTPEELAPRVDKFPLRPEDIIKLPKMKPTTFPKVQARFPTESTEQKRIRMQRQAAIKRAMTRSWEAYSTYAMGHDELRPVSGRHHDPFCGWGATLIDSLDTLQIMGMQTEYEEALKYVAKIDFAHTRSYSIPLFETVIRYLGGLIGAFDMSGGKDLMLLDKARDLADMLMGSFDTINRMPILRYDWRPQAARENQRASEDSCLAEIGTMTLEFTRLAQITGNHSYFDAVQRITDGFEAFSFSHVPGLFPLHIDASGCKYQEVPVADGAGQVVDAPVANEVKDTDQSTLEKRAAIEPHTHQKEDGHLEDVGRANMGNAMRESLADQTTMPAGQSVNSVDQVQAQTKCDPQGLIPSIYRMEQEFSWGGEADSTYEYFIKEHVLLGGAKEQYKNLYTAAVEAAKKYLFFRPLVEGDPDIRFVGKYRSHYNEDGTASGGELQGEMQHLTCFVGGMLAMGSRLLNRPEDLVLAEKITDGCVWAYNITATGVMPESFGVNVCYKEPCQFIMPKTHENDQPPKIQVNANEPIPGVYGDHQDLDHAKVKRAAQPEPEPQNAGTGNNIPPQHRQGPPLTEPPRPDEEVEVVEIKHNAMGDVDPEVAQLALDRQQATRAHQKITRPASFLYTWMDARYILRPEAIESVFYMYRITGDPVWQDKGWQMWQAIEKVSWTELAYSAITNVNDVNSTKSDSMESFWLAETLKYFYLLYSEPSLVSLDEWVFNTEAHPFKRPNLEER